MVKERPLVICINKITATKCSHGIKNIRATDFLTNLHRYLLYIEIKKFICSHDLEQIVYFESLSE